MPTADPLHPPVPQSNQRIEWANLPGSSLSLALSTAILQHQKTVVIITPDTLTANQLEYELKFFQQAIPILQFPDWETLPYDYFSPHQDIISGRLATLYQLAHLQQAAIITPISTVMHRLCPRDYLEGHTFLLKQKDKLPIEATRLRLEKNDYRCVNQVR